MKFKIRRATFETNSSSVHSISLVKNVSDGKKDYKVFKEGQILNVKFGEFGWEQNSYPDAYTKLSYALTMIAEIHRPKSKLEFYKLKDFIELNELIKEKSGIVGINVLDSGIHEFEGRGYHNGYIDHQAYEDYTSLDDFVTDNGVTLEDFIYSDACELETGNDNCYDYDYDYDER